MAIPYVPYPGPIVKRCDAMAAGLKFYYSGRPCKAGHLTQRRVIGGTCQHCRVTHNVDRDLRRASQKKWADANMEQTKARNRKYSKEHREQANAWAAIPVNRAKKKATAKVRRELIKATTDPEELRAKWRLDYARDPAPRVAATKRWKANNVERDLQYRLETKDAIRQRSKDWAQQNPERARAKTRKWQLANPEAVKNWKKANPATVKAIKQNRRARERNAEGRHTAAEIKALYAKQGGRCVYCKKALADKYDIDHITPLSRGGSNWVANLQLLCGSCNSRKWAADPIEYARRIGLLL